ncbi:unnamed protein product [Acanthoscelides obtectus]|uniref:Uncharacterized protein n=1 Tax=Acanthoscelides obtectus TaxID=200917 RepID=A0A9P0QFF6_ACAOB|nr:unnamed protein product [Acanthoscelides obtectus]CAK1627192.1 hypothetical protein AOBTE_LOCUS4375 [Acanthoscelides obtectus]
MRKGLCKLVKEGSILKSTV